MFTESIKKRINMGFIRIFFSSLLFAFVYQNIFAIENSFEWQLASPESQGMSTDRLYKLRDNLVEKGT